MNKLESLFAVSLCALTLSLQGDQVSVYNASPNQIYVAIVQTNKDNTIYEGTTVKGKKGTVSLYTLDAGSYWPIERPSRAVSKDTDLLFSKDKAALESVLTNPSTEVHESRVVQQFNIGQLFTKRVVIEGSDPFISKTSQKAIKPEDFKKASSSEPFKLGTGGEHKAINEKLLRDDMARNAARFRNVLQKAITETDQKLKKPKVLTKEEYCEFAQRLFKTIDDAMGGAFSRVFSNVACSPEGPQYQNTLNNAVRELMAGEGAPQGDKPTFRSGSVEAQLLQRFVDKIVELAEKVKKSQEKEQSRPSSKPTVPKQPVEAVEPSQLQIALEKAVVQVEEKEKLISVSGVFSQEDYCAFVKDIFKDQDSPIGWFGHHKMKNVSCDIPKVEQALKGILGDFRVAATRNLDQRLQETKGFGSLVDKLILLAKKVTKVEVPKQPAQDAGSSELQIAIAAAIKQIETKKADLGSSKMISGQEYCAFVKGLFRLTDDKSGWFQRFVSRLDDVVDCDAQKLIKKLEWLRYDFMSRGRSANIKQHDADTEFFNQLVEKLTDLAKRVQRSGIPKAQKVQEQEAPKVQQGVGERADVSKPISAPVQEPRAEAADATIALLVKKVEEEFNAIESDEFFKKYVKGEELNAQTIDSAREEELAQLVVLLNKNTASSNELARYKKDALKNLDTALQTKIQKLDKDYFRYKRLAFGIEALINLLKLT